MTRKSRDNETTHTHETKKVLYRIRKKISSIIYTKYEKAIRPSVEQNINLTVYKYGKGKDFNL